MSAPKHDMRTVMGHFATGVCVVSTRRGDGKPVATTVNAVTSVSLEPPLLLVCLAHDSETLAAVEESGRFAVNVLAESQREHSIRFAAKGRARERARGRLRRAPTREYRACPAPSPRSPAASAPCTAAATT